MQLSFQSITTDMISLFGEKKISAAVLRLDKIHPVISGNKWFKLQYYIKEALEQKKSMIVTFGGAWSNHIVATAAACKMNGLSSVGIIRGDEPSSLSPTLINAKQFGMQLHFISREEYSKKTIPEQLIAGEYYLVQEGGYGQKGAEGASHILDHIKMDFTHLCCAVGTGTMMAGLINAVMPEQQVIGISVLKNNTGLEKEVQFLLGEGEKNWRIIHDFHFGGYAKYNTQLIDFMNSFYGQTNIPSDFVYTGKLFYAINDLVKRELFPQGSRLLLIHSGGLQGNNSLKKGTLIY